MSLQFIAGAGGSGRSRYVYEKIIERSLEESGRSFYVLVPEQYSMQAQGDLVKLHPKGCITNIDVLNFTRLSHRVFDETGFNSGPVLDDTGKVLVLNKVAQSLAGSLPVLGRVMNKPGAVSMVKSLISEFMQYRVSPGDLQGLEDSGALTGPVRYKVEDIRKLYSGFLEYINGKYITAEEMPHILSERLSQTDFLKGADVVLDGFTGFVPSQLEVIGKMLTLCRNVTVVLTMDEDSGAADILKGKRKKVPAGELFGMSAETALAVMKKAYETGTEILPPLFIRRKESENGALDFLSDTIYRKGVRSFTGPCEGLYLSCGAGPKEEIVRISETIKRLVRTEGYRYRDFAVVTGDPGTYDDIIEDIFGECGIPCFIDRKKPVTANPAAEFIRSAVGLVTDRFSYKSVFRYLRCGMTDFSADEIDMLETYVLAAGVRGLKNYKEEWSGKYPTIDDALLEKINDIRVRFADSVSEYAEAMSARSSTVYDKTKALYALIEKNEIQKKCSDMADAFEEAGEQAFYREYSQVYRVLMDDLDKTVEILGTEKVSLKTYEQIMEAVLEERKLGLVPPGIDRVTAGDIERSRLAGVKVLFLAGVNEGLIPAPAQRPSMLSAAEREQIKKSNIVLAPDEREELMRQRFYIYLALSRPSEKLFISWAASSMSAKAMQPSTLILQIKRMFPDLGLYEAGAREELPYYMLETEYGRERLLSMGFQRLRYTDPGDIFMELGSWYVNDDRKAELFAKARTAYESTAPDEIIAEDTARTLYGPEVMFSATRLERFAGCAFAHFLQFGLDLKERDIREWTAMDRGSLVHKALQNFVLMVNNGPYEWKSLSEETRKEISGQAFQAALDEYKPRLLTDSRSVFATARLGELVDINTWGLTEQIRRGSFIPYQTEMFYRTSGVKGVIDRIDMCEHDGINYMRIIDYKTGVEKLDLAKLIYGAKIQLPLYIKAAADMAKNMPGTYEPAGIYYHNIQDPVIDVDLLEAKPGEETLLSPLRLTGISREEPEILTLTDRYLVPGVSSDVVKVSIKKDGTPSSTSETVSADDFDLLYKYTGYIVDKMRDRILRGDAGIHPLTDGKDSACDFCSYRGICRFDRRIKGYTEVMCEKREKDEALRKMREIIGQ